jgi:hypothetical protein
MTKSAPSGKNIYPKVIVNNENYLLFWREGLLSKNKFQVSQWLINDQSDEKFLKKKEKHIAVPKSVRKKVLPSFLQRNKATDDLTSEFESQFNPKSFFIKGWTGESLASKRAKDFVKLLGQVQGEVKKNVLKPETQLTRKLKLMIFNEFIAYAEITSFNSVHFDDVHTFWSEATNKTSRYYNDIQSFFDYYCLRTAFVFLVKVRFINGLCRKARLPFNQKSIIYPNAFLMSFFPKGSRFGLNAKAIETNVYSWYTPGLDITSEIIKNSQMLEDLQISEIIKNYDIKIDRIIKKNSYSHTLSHRNLGLFLNLLNINLPIWLKSKDGKFMTEGELIREENIELLSLKFTGDHLMPLSHSHWLAQENNHDFRWDQILCADFSRSHESEDVFSKVSNELFFLTFLLRLSENYQMDYREFIVQVINGNSRNLQSSHGLQASLLPLETGEKSYNRIVLNLTDFPKNNAQHFLINQILAEHKNLKEDGYLFVVSSKKLFVSSQKDKVQNLLNKFKVQGVIDLSELAGKGEIGNHIYILSKRDAYNFKAPEKESTPVFRVSGSLDTFQDFQDIIALFEDFFEAHLNETPVMHQKSNEAGTSLEYFIEAIAEGQLIHSSSKDNTKVTHPQYFQKLLKSCFPLSYFFDIENVNFSQKGYHSFEFNLPEAQEALTNMPLVLIVDNRTKVKTKLEIISRHSLESKIEEYGQTLCSYFGISSKWPNLNIDAVIDYLNSPIGEQIIDITFNETNKKVKATVSKVLIPSIFLNRTEIPSHLVSALSFFELTSPELLNKIPSELEKNFEQSLTFLEDLVEEYPGEILSKISTFRRHVQKALDDLESNGTHNLKINFNNPMIKSPLLMSKTSPLLPDNEEVFVAFQTNTSIQSLHGTLTETQIRPTETESLLCLELYTENGLTVSIHSHKYMIYFVEFLATNAKNVPLNLLLKGIKVPLLADLERIVDSFEALNFTLSDISKQIPTVQNQFINKAILNG